MAIITIIDACIINGRQPYVELLIGQIFSHCHLTGIMPNVTDVDERRHKVYKMCSMARFYRATA